MMQVLLATSLLVAWQFPRQYTPPPTRFVITYRMASQGAALQEFATSLSAIGACTAVGDADEDTFCAQLPTCPAATEVVMYAVHAERDSERSESSSPVMCQMLPGCRCQVIPLTEDPAAAPPPPPPPDPPSVPPEADPRFWTAQLEALLKTLPKPAT